MLILASQSPRRKELLEQAGLEFEVITPIEDEKNQILSKNNPENYVEQLSLFKALDVFSRYPNGTVIGADTVVVLGNEILEKPIDEADAFIMLKKLSGQKHRVITGVTLMSSHYKETFSTSTDVYFKELTDFEIKTYISTKEPLDKAGSYAIQGLGSKLIEKHEGDLFTVIGLPLKEVVEKLKKAKN